MPDSEDDTPRLRVTRRQLAMAAAAALGTAACGSSDDEGADDDQLTGGGEDLGREEQSCAGLCGSHHTPDCADDEPDCPAPPYGAPPFDPIV